MKRTTVWIAAFTLVASVFVGLAGLSSASATSKYTTQTLHFKVVTGAAGATPCDILGDLYLPAGASKKRPVPAILTTNGFGGSKNDQAGIGKTFAARGYAVLSYSGLGFGGSSCKITLDDPDFDGRAASQLVSFLGGAGGIAFTDAKHTKSAPVLTVVKRDEKNHLGKISKHDPRVGMVGGSYGGQVQFAAASVDPRIDTIVPIITWSDLSYSLGPNNTDQTRGVMTATPGAIKLIWGVGFSALGVANGLQNIQSDPARMFPCPNFATFVCPALVTAATTGYFQATDIAALRHASVASYIAKIKVPTLVIQGLNDTLFNINEGVANYQALKKQKTPVKMIWQSWGHTNLTPAPGEIDLAAPNPSTQYETARVAAWFERYLKDREVSTGPEFAYFRDWISYQGIATPAYATAASYPVGSNRTMYLSGTGDLATNRSAISAGSSSFVTPLAGLPTSLDPADALGSFLKTPLPLPEVDLPGTFASYRGGVLASSLRVVGAPVLKLKVAAPTVGLTQISGPLGKLVLIVKVVDIGPDGKSALIKNLVAPVRVPDVNKPFTVTLPGIAHQFDKGHRIGLIVAGGSLNYRGNVVAAPVTIASGSTQTLSLPVVN